ncbi:MAG: peptidylprolyl isomerase [Butyrivibrio sp.]|nr:peptidylprolyl isomerase [Butyrivibrio sp.]
MDKDKEKKEKRKLFDVIRILIRHLAALFVVSSLLAGCAAVPADSKVVFTTGFGEEEVFRIEDSVCSLTETLVYLVNTQKGYEESFGSGIWEVDTDSGTVRERLKDSVLAKVAQIKAMNLLAVENGIELDDNEKNKVEQAAEEYYSSLSQADIAAMNGLTKEELVNIYAEQAVADKLYEYIIRDINPEISDDEARTITVEQIFLKTYSLDAQGEKAPYDGDKKAEVYRTARSILNQLDEGTSFEELMAQYNEAEDSTISFGKGKMESAYETAAFNLGTEEVSDVVETGDGYVIIKCISTFNREETEANKVKIVAQRKREVFGQQYDAFVATLTKELNQKLWDSVDLVSDENVSAGGFMEVYNKYFK